MQTKERKRRARGSTWKAVLYSIPFLFFSAGEPRLKEEPRQWNEYVFSTTRDAYQQLDKIDADPENDNDLEEKMGIKILGHSTNEDIKELEKFYDSPQNKQRRFFQEDIGLERIVIFPRHLLKYTDSIGRADKEQREIDVFSGLVNSNGLLYHEFTHMAVFALQENEPEFEARWRLYAGGYDHVLVEEQPELNVTTFSYKDKEKKYQGPYRGYINPYGGTSFHEDVATFVQRAIYEPERFKEVGDSFHVYHKKIDLLFETGFLVKQEWRIIKSYLDEAEKRETKQTKNPPDSTKDPF